MPEVTYYTGKAQSDDALTAYLKEYKVASYGKDVPDSSGLILTMILTYVLPIVVMWLLFKSAISTDGRTAAARWASARVTQRFMYRKKPESRLRM